MLLGAGTVRVLSTFVALTQDAGGIWRGHLPAVAPDKWYVELGNDRWRPTAPVRMPVSRGALVLHAPDRSGSAPPPPTPET